MLSAKLVTIAGLNATEVQIKPLWLKLRDATRSLSRRNCLNLQFAQRVQKGTKGFVKWLFTVLTIFKSTNC